ncbi:MAG TPA: hypothetical protein VFL65_04460 [Jatrophihabitans sp.]|nr:hypothetical protein [Jatrophihabitans sp.]
MKTLVASVLLVPSAALVLAGCGSSGGGSSSSPPSKSAPPSTSAAPTTAAGLGQAMQSAIKQVSSAHLTVSATVAGQSVNGSGDEKLSDGKVTGMEITEGLPAGGGSVEVIVVGGKTYVKLPSALNLGGKPYQLVTPNSSNPVVKRLAGTMDSAVSSASVEDVSAFVQSARSVKKVGTTTVAGVPTTHYTAVVDVAKLPANLPARQQLTAAGVTSVPVQLYVDSSYRPVQVSEQLTVQGQKVSTNALFSRYNAPVSISAPPSGQVGG